MKKEDEFQFIVETELEEGIEDVPEKEDAENFYEIEETELVPVVGEEVMKTKEENSIEIDTGKDHFRKK